VVLLQPKPRAVTALSMDDNTELLCMSSDIYNRMIEKAVKKDIQARVNYLQGFRIFKQLSVHQLEKLLYYLTPIDCMRGKVIYKIGDKPDGIFLVQSGAFEVSMPAGLDRIAEKESGNFIMDAGAKFRLLK